MQEEKPEYHIEFDIELKNLKTTVEGFIEKIKAQNTIFGRQVFHYDLIKNQKRQIVLITIKLLWKDVNRSLHLFVFLTENTNGYKNVRVN